MEEVTYLLHCPFCNDHLDPCLNPSGRLQPQDWQPLVCFCGRVCVIDYAMPGRLRVPADDDWAAWGREPTTMRNITRALHAVERLRELRDL
jgi:hypothetical protein